MGHDIWLEVCLFPNVQCFTLQCGIGWSSKFKHDSTQLSPCEQLERPSNVPRYTSRIFLAICMLCEEAPRILTLQIAHEQH